MKDAVIVRNDSNIVKKLYRTSVTACSLAVLGGSLSQVLGVSIAAHVIDARTLAVVVVCLPVVYLYTFIFSTFSLGGMIVCSDYIGKDQYEEANSAFTMIYILSISSSLAASLLLYYFAPQTAAFLGARGDIFDDTVQYLRFTAICGIGAALRAPSNNLLHFISIPDIISIGEAILNVLLILYFIVYRKLGVAYLALSYGISRTVAGIIGTGLFFSKSSILKFTRKTSLEAAKKIVSFGSSGAIESCCLMLCTLTVNLILAKHFGNTSLSSYKILDSAGALTTWFVSAISISILRIGGVYLTELDMAAVRKILKYTLLWGFTLILPIAASLLLFSAEIAAFLGDPSPSSGAAIYWLALTLPLSLANNIIIYFYMADKKTSLANMLLSLKLYAFPVLFILIFKKFWALSGVWYAFPAAEALLLVFTVTLSVFLRGFRTDKMPILLIDTSPEKRGAVKTITVLPASDSIAGCFTEIEAFGEANNLKKRTINRITLALEELLVVISEKSAPEDISVRMLIFDGKIVLRLRCMGRHFDPLLYAENPPPGEAENVMGIALVMKFAINLLYRTTFGVNNTVIVVPVDSE